MTKRYWHIVKRKMPESWLKDFNCTPSDMCRFSLNGKKFLTSSAEPIESADNKYLLKQNLTDKRIKKIMKDRDAWQGPDAPISDEQWEERKRQRRERLK